MPRSGAAPPPTGNVAVGRAGPSRRAAPGKRTVAAGDQGRGRRRSGRPAGGHAHGDLPAGARARADDHPSLITISRSSPPLPAVFTRRRTRRTTRHETTRQAEVVALCSRGTTIRGQVVSGRPTL